MPADKQPTNDTGDSAPANVSSDAQNKPSKGKKASFPKKGGGSGKDPTFTKKQSETVTSKTTPGFAEGNQVLQSYNLSVSGYKERVLSPFKADKFFHIVEDSYKALVNVKPSIATRFSFAEFRHATALQVYHRLEQVKFDTLGIKPSAPTRIPLPRNLRVFQPIWSVLANIGYVDDDELRVQYIPDSVLPDSDDLDSEHDINGLLDCTLYDWKSSWKNVKTARDQRKPYAYRDGLQDKQTSNEAPLTREALIKTIRETKQRQNSVNRSLTVGIAKVINGSLYYFPEAKADGTGNGKEKEAASTTSFGGKRYNTSLSDDDLQKTKAFKTPDDYEDDIDKLMDQARRKKEEMITPKFDVSYQSEHYQVSDGRIEADPGAYGARLHWDPELWLDYENFVRELEQICLFSLTMPNETSGTYAWILPVEKRQGSEYEVFAKMPKASIPPVTWILALLLQSSTLPHSRRSTFYCETDVLGNVLGLRKRYIDAAIKRAGPVEQYGTY